MDDMEKRIEKLIKAGIDAVSEGLNITREAVSKMVEKGEPLFDQARSTVNETAEQLRDTVANNVEFRQAVDDAKRALLRLNKEQLLEVQGFIARLIETVDKECADSPCVEDKAPDIGPVVDPGLECKTDFKPDGDIRPLEQDIPKEGLGPNKQDE
ncbi:MAG: hypothetical protein IKI84_07455 [Clostridia bacterium]|nr:hypothetical protein [Clostridia bacterium]